MENCQPITNYHIIVLYYQVHKLQPIIKCHVLLVGFIVTIQGPTKICHKKHTRTHHMSTHVRNDTSNSIKC